MGNRKEEGWQWGTGRRRGGNGEQEGGGVAMGNRRRGGMKRKVESETLRGGKNNQGRKGKDEDGEKRITNMKFRSKKNKRQVAYPRNRFPSCGAHPNTKLPSAQMV